MKMIMILPSVSKCKENKKQLIKKWLKNNNLNDKELKKRKNFFQKCFVFHHFIIPDEIAHCRNFTSKTSELLPDRLLKSSYDISVSKLFRPVGNTIKKLDPLLGLDQYVFFSFGVPIKPTGNTALIFSIPLQKLLDKYEYPQMWVSWGDIITYAVDILGDQYFHNRKIEESQFSRIAQQYQDTIFHPEDIAELAAAYTISHNIGISEVINRKWHMQHNGYFGPEIKINRCFPFNYFTLCFTNDLNSIGGQFAKFLYKEGILPVEPILDRFFGKDIFRQFYTEYMGISI